jgi:Na+/melibiose symporter-like transporter
VFAELVQTLSNRSFLALFAGAAFLAIGIGVAASLNVYVLTYFWGLGARQIGSIVYFQFASALIAPLLTAPLTRRFGKRRVAISIAVFSLVFGGLPIALRLLGWFPENGDPWLLPLLRGHGLVQVTAFIVVSIALSSMIADIAEHHEVHTGRREEGLFFAARNFALKASTGIGTLLAGVALDAIAFPRDVAPEAVAPEVVRRLGWVAGPALMAVYAVAVACIGGYRITREDHARHLAILAGRAGS